MEAESGARTGQTVGQTMQSVLRIFVTGARLLPRLVDVDKALGKAGAKRIAHRHKLFFERFLDHPSRPTSRTS